MTNYEWLVKTHRLVQFILDVRSTCTENDLIKLNANYYGFNYFNSNKMLFSQRIADWLQEEHKEEPTYVKYDEVLDVINKTAYEILEDMVGDEAMDLIDFKTDIINRISKLNKRKIKEPSE